MTEWLVPVDNGDAVLQAGGCSCIVPRFQSTINCCPLIARSDARYIVYVLPSVDTGYGVVWTFGLVAPPEVGRRRNFEERARCYFFHAWLGGPPATLCLPLLRPKVWKSILCTLVCIGTGAWRNHRWTFHRPAAEGGKQTSNHLRKWKS